MTFQEFDFMIQGRGEKAAGEDPQEFKMPRQRENKSRTMHITKYYIETIKGPYPFDIAAPLLRHLVLATGLYGSPHMPKLNNQEALVF